VQSPFDRCTVTTRVTKRDKTGQLIRLTVLTRSRVYVVLMLTVSPKFLTLRRVAQRVGVPIKWLKAEAEAGRIPTISVSGGRRLADPEQVAEALQGRAEKGVEAT